jgi:hypothetical protein
MANLSTPQLTKALIASRQFLLASVVRGGGGESVRRVLLVSMLSLTVALMVAQPVSAEVLTTYVIDAEGDVPYIWDSQTGEAMTEPTNGNQQWCKYGYFDMTFYTLSKNLNTNMFTFEMTVADDFPELGEALPSGVQRVDWLIWFDPAPFNWVFAPDVITEYQLNLTYDGTQYNCSFCDYVLLAGDVIETLAFDLDGTVLSTSFSGNLVGDIVEDLKIEFYWEAVIRVIHGGYSCNWADWTDWNVAKDQMWSSIPWPLACENPL